MDAPAPSVKDVIVRSRLAVSYFSFSKIKLIVTSCWEMRCRRHDVRDIQCGSATVGTAARISPLQSPCLMSRYASDRGVRALCLGEQFLHSGACERLDKIALEPRCARELTTGMLTAIRQCNQSQFLQ